MQTLTASQLNDILYNTVVRAYQRYFVEANYLAACYHIGCRSTEIAGNITLSYDSNTQVLIYEQPKTHIIRTVQIQSNDFFTADDLTGIIPQLSTYSYATIERAFIWSSNGQQMKVGQKNGGVHLFRHNYAKQQRSLGLSDIQVAGKMGLTTAGSALRYINSNVILL